MNYHSESVGHADDGNYSRGLSLRVAVVAHQLSEVEVWDDEPDEEEDRRDGEQEEVGLKKQREVHHGAE